MMDIAHAIAPLYTGLDRDTLIVGILIHDIGKVEELSVGQGFAYTDAGQLLGHLALGQDMVSAKIVEVEKTLGTQFPPQTRLRLFHMLLSHHGLLEHGSPKLPMTPEAVALHQIDSMDSRMNMVLRHIEENRAQGAWAPWHPALQRRLYRGPV
jgi:3'-5' exoribonuclease